VRVLAIWEPVIVTDVGPPTSATLARLGDARVEQFWDAERAVSEAWIREARRDPARYGFREAPHPDTIVWDVVAVFAPEASWGDLPPAPAVHGYPVVDAIEDVRRAVVSLPGVRPGGGG
jgi:hypothetical protein